MSRLHLLKPHHHGTLTGYNYGCREECCRSAPAEYQRRRKESNPAALEAHRAQVKKWRAGNRDKHNDTNRRWREANPEAQREAERRWRANNPDAAKTCIRTSSSRRRARQVEATVEIFSDTEIFERDNWVCHICNEPVDPKLKRPNAMSVSLDHVVPLSRGGEHSRENTACSHLKCNLQKWAH